MAASEAAILNNGAPVECSIEPEVLAQMAAAAVEGLTRLRHGGLEVGGILFGRRSAERVLVEAAVPIDCEYAFGPVFRLSARDIERVREMRPPGRGLNTVGWYVSHTRTALELNAEDQRFGDEHFGKAGSVAVVMKPAAFQPTRVVVYVRDDAGRLVQNAQGEFEVGGPAKSAEPLRTEAPETGQPVPAAPPVPVANGNRLATAAVVVLVCMTAAVAGGWLAYQPRRGAAVPPAASKPLVIESASTPDPLPPAPAKEKDPRDPRVQELERELATLRAKLDQEAERAKTPARIEPDHPPRTYARFMPPPSSRKMSSERDVAITTAPPAIGGSITAPSIPTVLPKAALPAVAAAPVVKAGRVIWTGNLKKGGLLFLDERGGSVGGVNGRLPGVPVRVQVHAGELVDSGLVVYSADPARNGRTEAPGALNGWNHTLYEFDVRRAANVKVLEAPGPQNKWSKVVVRVDRPASVLMVDWETTGER